MLDELSFCGVISVRVTGLAKAIPKYNGTLLAECRILLSWGRMNEGVPPNVYCRLSRLVMNWSIINDECQTHRVHC